MLQQLATYPEEIVARDNVARRYERRLEDVTRGPRLIEGASSVCAEYATMEGGRRPALAAKQHC